MPVPACQVAPERPDVTYRQEVTAGEFMLHAQAELLHIGPPLAVRNRGVTCRSDGPGTWERQARNDAVITLDVIRGRTERYRRIAFAALSLGLVAISGLEVDAVAAANHRLAVALRVIGKTEARCEVLARVPQLAAVGDPVVPAFHQAVAEGGVRVEAG